MAELTVTLTCPACVHASIETMPTNGCVVFHECVACHTSQTKIRRLLRLLLVR